MPEISEVIDKRVLVRLARVSCLLDVFRLPGRSIATARLRPSGDTCISKVTVSPMRGRTLSLGNAEMWTKTSS